MTDNFQDLLNHATRIQEEMQDAQSRIDQQEVVGASGGGLVEVSMNGRHDVSRVKISDEVMDDREVLEDLVAGAINDAVRKVDNISQETIKNLAFGKPNIDFLNSIR